MKKTFLFSVLCLIFFSGCAGLSFETKRFVENNNFYSSQFPSLTITVNNELQYDSDKNSNNLTNNTDGTISTSVSRTWYYFLNRDKKRELNIFFEKLSDPRWHMISADYSKQKYLLSTGKETLAGLAFDTGIFVIPKKSYALLAKAYGKTSGDSVRFQIFYLEHVENEWLTEPALYTSQQREYLTGFRVRADKSFTVSGYTDPTGSTIPSSVQVENRETNVTTTKERFQNLQDLFESGLMTEDEYDAKRKEIMSEL